MNWYKRSAEHIETIRDQSMPVPEIGVDILLNPTSAEIGRLAKKTGEIRGIIVDTDQFWAWNAYDVVHAVVYKHLGKTIPISNGIPVLAGVHGGKIYWITITDASRNTQWFENPAVKNAVLSNQPFMSLAADEFLEDEDYGVHYFNQDIVGQWDEIDTNAIDKAVHQQDQGHPYYEGRQGD